jgi:hypothetical protein
LAKFDVFISYSHADQAWVENELLRRLEIAGLRACIDHRDFAAGAPIATEIERAIRESRKTILVLSPDYLKSQWAEYESLIVQTAGPSNRNRRLVPVLHKPCKLPSRLSFLIYVDLSDGKASEESWSRLLVTLGSKRETGVGARPLEPPALRCYFDHLIEDHCQLFTGRTENLRQIDTFLQQSTGGYFFVEGPSGYGKTALLANLVQTHPQVAYHFISQVYKVQGSDFDPTELDSLLSNLLEQLEGGGTQVSFQSPRARFQHLLRTAPGEKARVIVIDAVDEVDRHPSYLYGLLPTTLAPGVFVVLSARTLGDRSYLKEIGLRPNNLADSMELVGLDERDIADLLRKAGVRSASLSAAPEFVELLSRISQGDPFYLRFLVEDIAAGVITAANLHNVPSGLNGYLDLQLSILDRGAHLPQHRDILGIILDALGPVGREDLIHMVDGLDRLNFDNVIRDIERFLLVFNSNYTFCHPRFKEYFQAKARNPVR